MLAPGLMQPRSCFHHAHQPHATLISLPRSNVGCCASSPRASAAAIQRPQPTPQLPGIAAAQPPRARAFGQQLRSQLPLQATAAGSTEGGSSSNNEEAEDSDRDVLERFNSLQRSCVSCDDQDAGPHVEALRSISCFDASGLPQHHTSRRGVTNQVQLSTYADCIGADLTDLTDFLQTHVKDAIGSLHLLPLYPSSGDRGFAPITYGEIDPAFGTWSNVQDLAAEYQLCLELMVNHISPASPQFQDFVQHGDASPFADMFVRWADIWPEGGKPTAAQLARVRTRKPAPPVLEVHMADGSSVGLWCTFSDQQIDINPFSEEGWAFLHSSLRSLCKHNAKLIRLDAFGYCKKRANTPCFMEAPEVWELLARIKSVVKPWGVQLLCEVHEDFRLNIELARNGYWTYDFALPLLVLHGLRFGTAEPLRNWLSICPRRQIVTLDTHDGMGVDDIAGLPPLVDVKELEQCILGHGGTINYKHHYRRHAAVGEDGEQEGCAAEDEDDAGGGCCKCSSSSAEALQAAKDFLQPDCLKGCYVSEEHQYNATYYSALREDRQQYLLARAIQFFTPGVPMVYYVGLLAGVNDYQLLAAEGAGVRDINRHYYSLEEAEQAVQQPVVQALFKLCRFRNFHPAFKGRVFIDDAAPTHVLRVAWYLGSKHLAVLNANLQAHTFTIRHTPYRVPSEEAAAQDNKDDDEEFHSDYSLDMQEVAFSIDAMDNASRAALRTKLHTEHHAESGVVDAAAYVAALSRKGSSPAAAAGGGVATDGGSESEEADGAQDQAAHEREMARRAAEWDLLELDLSWGWGAGTEEGAAPPLPPQKQQ